MEHCTVPLGPAKAIAGKDLVPLEETFLGREMAALSALLEDPCLIPSAHVRSVSSNCSSRSRGSDPPDLYRL